MIVMCDSASGSVTLREADVFTGFHVDAPGDAAIADIAKALGTPEADKADHVWVTIDQIRSLVGETNADWESNFTAMLGYASGKGWMSDSGDMILAHIERS